MVKKGEVEEDEQEQEDQLKRKVVDKLSKDFLKTDILCTLFISSIACCKLTRKRLSHYFRRAITI